MENKIVPRKVLFIDRDGTLITEPPGDCQLDDFSKLEFYPEMFSWLSRIASEGAYDLVMVTNQDGLGTASFPEEKFWPCQQFIEKTLAGEGIKFKEICIDKSFPHENKATRKPGTAMLSGYMDNEEYDLANSYVIGDRLTDVELASNLGCKAIFINTGTNLGTGELAKDENTLQQTIALETRSWKEIWQFLKLPARKIHHDRITNETKIYIDLNLDGNGKSDIHTGLGFFDHMLDQLARHTGMDITLKCEGDLHIDEHHTIEDTGIAIGEALMKALGDKRGIERYGFLLPMDDCLAHVAIDFGGRNWIVWDADFKREKIGEMPTEMFFHFFKSFSDASKSNLNIKAEGDNEHHKIESIFKAFAKAIKAAIKRDPDNNNLPTTKGIL